MRHFFTTLLMLTLIMSSSAIASKHVISNQSGKTGFFYNFLGVVNNLIWCKKNNFKPVVYWGPTNLYYQHGGYMGKFNAWEYYFEPVSDEVYKPSDHVWEPNKAPDKTSIAPIRWELCDQYAQQQLRDTAHTIIKEYIKLRSHMIEKIEAFYNIHMAHKKTIGIHLRGTDKKKEIKQVDPEYILNSAQELAKRYSGCQFLIATDDERLLEKAKTILNGKVIYYDAHRSKKGDPIHYDKRNTFAKKNMHRAHLGEEVLIEAHLLSRCDLFLHTCSAVSTAVLFLNPQLEHKSYR